MNPKEESAGKVSVELLKPHQHAGRQYHRGDVIKVRQDQAEWLMSIKVAKHGPEAQQPEKAAVPAGLAVAPSGQATVPPGAHPTHKPAA